MAKRKGVAVSVLGADQRRRLAQLRTLFPESLAESPDGVTLTAEVLTELIGAMGRRADAPQFGLIWPGKQAAARLAQGQAAGVLCPCPEESLAWADTRNLFIEGDNLQALKLLRTSHAGKIQLIYIDPPYNTGNDYVYRDRFQDTTHSYLRLIGEECVDRWAATSTDTRGRAHARWLSMMYPRLLIARDLLAQTGVMLISIGDEEVHHLRSLCDEIFGDAHFCGTFIWEKKRKPSFLDPNMGRVTEYILAYAKDRAQSPPFVAGRIQSGKKYPFNNTGNGRTVLTFPRASVRFGCSDQHVRAQDMSHGSIETVLLDDVDIVGGTNRESFRLRGEWRYSQTTVDEFVAAGDQITIRKVPFRPNYVSRGRRSKRTTNLLSYRVNGVPTNEDARVEMRAVFGADVMSYPKPSGLLKYLVRAICGPEDVVLDFFAGSGSTAVGVMAQNAEDHGRRPFILIQAPEVLDPANRAQKEAAHFCDGIGRPQTIAELTKERLRRTAAPGGDDAHHGPQDRGFRVFRVSAVLTSTCVSAPPGPNLS
ncbi:MAG TPA: site-specific DNA-methyltransferase [Acidiferrobacter sp.]|nr:site-specific DNA-methyltransferase [Acidiferrobacter sp.]